MTHITTANDDEKPLAEYSESRVAFTHLPDDPLAVRVSIGEPHVEIPGDNAYCVFRGDPRRVLALLRRIVAAMRFAPPAAGGPTPEARVVEAACKAAECVLAEVREEYSQTEFEHVLDELQDDVPAAIRRAVAALPDERRAEEGTR